MKKIIILIIICLYGVYFANASTVIIQGQLTNNINNIGITNHSVYVSDSVSYYDTIMTNANGYFYLVITGVNPGPNLNYFISTKDCNNYTYTNIVHSTDSVTIVNFSICDNTPVNCQNSFTTTHQNLLYNFSGLNINTYPTYYFWSFGDGTFAAGQNTSHSFQQPVSGVVTYTVTLNTQTIFPNDTCLSQTTQLINIIGNSPVISGTVSAGGLNLKSGFVYLYGINNPVASCNLIDTAGIDSSGFYYFNNFQVNYTAYLVKAVLPDNSPLSGFYMPTYYDTLASWINSPPVFPVTDGTQYNIHLLPLLSNPSGTGSISGNVSQSGIKNTVISGVEVHLYSQNNQPLRLTKTDNSGNYSFTNLSFDNYKVFVEIAGKISNPAFITLDNSTPNADHVNFEITGNSITLAIDENYNQSSQISALYPNPAKDYLFIDFNLQKATNVKVIICNNVGQVLQNYEIAIDAGYQQIHLNTITLPEGFYTVQIINPKFTSSKKFIKIK